MIKDVYIEYSNTDFEYISFTKAKKLIKKEQPPKIKYHCTDQEKSIDFLNALLTIYKIDDDALILK